MAVAATTVAMPSLAAASASRTILVVGDSLSAEYGLARGSGWVALLEQRLAREHVGATVVNASISGDTTAGGLARLPALLRDRKPDLVVIELGANDALRGLPLEERRKVVGLNPERADIIVPGAAILETLMTELGLKALHTSERALRDGLLQDYLIREEQPTDYAEMSVRARSVHRLMQVCHVDTRHAEQVTRLALELFDSARDAGIHQLGAWERELLAWAGHLHDIGVFLSYTNHHQHSYYIIRNADLLGFDQLELDIMATTAFFHRRTFPRKKHPEFAALDERAQQIVRVLCVLLRIAESLDRGHAGQVADARFLAGKKGVTLQLTAPSGCQMELWGVQHHADAVEKAFGRKMKVEVNEK
jgi:exopolyphosphatase/guanosine-5'-triphosphate,3'-diphosphate pyrophosphatase